MGRYSARLGEAKQHIFTLCYAGLQVHTDLRGRMHKAREVVEIAEIVRELQARPRGVAGPFCSAPDAYTAWYHRHKWEWWKHEAGLTLTLTLTLTPTLTLTLTPTPTPTLTQP